MRRLVVFIRFPDGQVAIAGELAFADLRADGSAPSAFRYAPEWLERAGAFALDPESLPLRPGEFRASHLGPPLGVFDDSLPDDWGRRLLVLEHRLPRAEQVPARFLLESGADTMGALAYGPDRRPPTPRRRAGTAADLAGAAERFDAGETLDDATLHRLFEAGSTPGG
ncbi:MAG: HipA N-terminal domain-containing protein, partial [Rhodocyclaceae bacterium]|nr:HipA N-terminal domain-containing protein [Rhodocyclaceae bacterium]